MHIRRLSLIVLLLAFSLACNAVTRAFEPSQPTATAFETIAPTALAPTATAFETNLYIPPSCQGKPVATIPVATALARPTPLLSVNPEISKATQHEIFDKLTTRIELVYLYPDYNGLNWPALVEKYDDKIETGLDTESFYREMENFIEELDDEHSSFLSPADVAAANAELAGENEYVGIGVLILPMPKKGRVTLLSVLPGSAAERGGLKQHDSILAVDGHPIIEDGQEYSMRVRGPECSAVRLRVQSPGGEPREVMFMRYRITGSQQIVARIVPTGDGSRIGYIFIPTFFDETIPEQIMEALEEFGELDGLILDNRMNGGGSSTVVYPIMNLFTSGTVGHFVSRGATSALTLTAERVANSQDVPLVVLVGEDTVSFGEIFSGALQDIGRAKIVGQKTLGNVETLSGYDFSDGSQAWIAAERFDPLNSHADWERDGIIPDVEAYADWDTFTFETDPSVAAAVKLLGHE